jgi:hypothetical protein
MADISQQAVAPVEPLTKCGACGQTDDHPKHQISIGAALFSADGTRAYHEHDFDRNGSISYHFDCQPPKDENGLTWHEKVDPATQDHIRKVQALCAQGIKGDALRAAIVGGTV